MISWIAALAILLNGLMPLISQALDNAANGNRAALEWREVCSTTGSKWISSSRDAKPVDLPSLFHAKYCDYCFTHAASFGLPPVSDFSFLAPSFSFHHHSQSNQQFLLIAAWFSPAVRAPPVI
ncbi:DUF2946 domain-containing protein [Undibacterium sp. Dicai25W]|uniref:DUF2946 domain-containing protein n=1 Tax=Undibacterium sp. Dicai25W TaxID=3413034 RepID=UPI003BEFEE04